MTAGPLLAVNDLRVMVRSDQGDRVIVSGVDLHVDRGQAIAIVGESGSGKSMTARALIGLLPPGLVAEGDVVVGGHQLLTLGKRARAKLRGRLISLVLQDPFTMLNPRVRIWKQLSETIRDPDGGRISRARRREDAVRRLREVEITDPAVIDRYPFELSGGMRQRVGIACALAADPELLIADEPSTALDVTTQRQVLRLLRSIQEQRGMGLVLITHDLRVAFGMCDRVYVFYAGAVVEAASADALEDEPLHPYTLALTLSEPPADRRLKQLTSLPGSVPAPDDVAGRCPFSPRCRWAAPVCDQPAPLLAVDSDRSSACLRIAEIRPELAAVRREAAESEAHDAAEEERTPLLVVDAVNKTFRSGRRIVDALQEVSIEVRSGESVGVVGETGSGKTTLGRCLVGLETPDSGRITIDGTDVSRYASLDRQAARAVRQKVQLIFQDPYSSLNPARTIGGILQEALAQRIRQPGEKPMPVEELLALVGLPARYAERKPVALSGGERQRVAIARALAVQPRLVVCDEPVSALDVSVQAQILALFAELRERLDVAYLVITHDLSVVRQVVDRLYVLFQGRVVEAGPTDRVLDNPQHAYTRELVASVPRTDPSWLEIDPRQQPRERLSLR
jgi:peptide/nickel transport system ATP-binding protein